MSRREQIVSSLGTKEAREAFVDARMQVRLPAQIREMRLSRCWRQDELGERAKMRQGLISRYEKMGYDGFTLRTLRTLAAAFDVALKVQFVPFSELVGDASQPETHGLDVPSFADDKRLAAPDLIAMRRVEYYVFETKPIASFGTPIVPQIGQVMGALTEASWVETLKVAGIDLASPPVAESFHLPYQAQSPEVN